MLSKHIPPPRSLRPPPPTPTPTLFPRSLFLSLLPKPPLLSLPLSLFLPHGAGMRAA